MAHEDIIEALVKHYNSDVLSGKGGFWIKGRGFITLNKARQITGIKGQVRQPRMEYFPGGDYATIAMINRSK